MTREEIIREIRSARGEICVEMHNQHDVYYVKVVKSDLSRLFQEKFEQGEETGFLIHSNKYGVNFCTKDDGYILV